MTQILDNILKCPICKNGLLFSNKLMVECNNPNCNATFDIINKKPILVNYNKSIIKEDLIINNFHNNIISRNKYIIINFLKKILFGNGKTTMNNIKYLLSLFDNNEKIKILIIGGGTIGAGMDYIYYKFQSNIIAFDIYDSPNISFIGDAHDIPIIDDYFDLIIVQAVLEHVIYPSEVVNECYRVLKEGGLIYGETPFMQQVHEGAYDFTRYTDSGHRSLFRKFKHLKSGSIGGVGTTLLWSIGYFFSGLFRSRKIGLLFRIFFFWLRYFDLITPEIYNIDGASGVFFLGKKDSSFVLNDDDLIKYYKGAQ
jgi:SAM-dependent methyltransferase